MLFGFSNANKRFYEDGNHDIMQSLLLCVVFFGIIYLSINIYGFEKNIIILKAMQLIYYPLILTVSL